jgi:hypothetical protein
MECVRRSVAEAPLWYGEQLRIIPPRLRIQSGIIANALATALYTLARNLIPRAELRRQ